MKIRQIKKMIQVILNIPLESYTNYGSCLFNNSKLNWDINKDYEKSNLFYLNISIFNSEEEHHYALYKFTCSEDYEMLKERRKEIKEYLDEKIYNFLLNE